MLKTEILKKLRSTEGYVSGQEICDKFGVSRTAVWKAVNSLRDDGFVIDSVTNKGYQLQSGVEILTKSEIESRISSKYLGRNLCCYKEIDSTNEELKRLFNANNSLPNGTTAVTDHQTMGKGRRGRVWETPEGVNIAMSFLIKPEFEPGKASMLTLLAAIAVVKATEEVAGLECQIKWPNDVVINGKKYCGILTEMSSEPDFIHYVIVGIGINANTESFPEDIAKTATSVYLEKGEKISRAKLVAAILKYFEQYYERFEEALDMSPFMEEYNCLLAGYGQEVRVLDPNGEYTGISKGINNQGELLVEKEDRTLTEVYAGEVSVRGIYGYV